MTPARQWALVGGVVAVLGGLLLAATITTEGRGIGPGSTAPDFAAVTVPVDATTPALPRSIAAYRGRPMLLNIWATWCAPCREEMPRIERLHGEFAAGGLAVVAVSIDNPGMAEAIREFRRDMGLTFEIVYDESGQIRDAYQTTGVPETFLIDRAGVIRRRLIGASWREAELRPLLRELVDERAP